MADLLTVEAVRDELGGLTGWSPTRPSGDIVRSAAIIRTAAIIRSAA